MRAKPNDAVVDWFAVSLAFKPWAIPCRRVDVTGVTAPEKPSGCRFSIASNSTVMDNLGSKTFYYTSSCGGDVKWAGPSIPGVTIRNIPPGSPGQSPESGTFEVKVTGSIPPGCTNAVVTVDTTKTPFQRIGTVQVSIGTNTACRR